MPEMLEKKKEVISAGLGLLNLLTKQMIEADPEHKEEIVKAHMADLEGLQKVLEDKVERDQS